MDDEEEEEVNQYWDSREGDGILEFWDIEEEGNEGFRLWTREWVLVVIYSIFFFRKVIKIRMTKVGELWRY